MVDFVLEDNCRVAVHGIADLRQSLRVSVADNYLLRALDVTCDLGNGETAFRTSLLLIGKMLDMNVGIDFERISALPRPAWNPLP